MTKKFLTSSTTDLPRRLRDDLYQANKLITDGQQEQALKILDALDDKFPRQPDVLGLMVNIHLDTNNQHGYLHTIYKLHEITPTKAEVKLGLAGAYLANGYPALALQTFRKFLKRWPQSEHVPDVIKTIHILEKELEKILTSLGDDTSAMGFEFAALHEETRFMMESGNYSQFRHMASKLLQQRPTFVPILNNLSQVEWLEGNLAKAIEICQEILANDSKNIHALSNLARFLFMQGQTTHAWQVAEKLKESDSPAAERWIKKAEALSFIGDDAGVLALIAQAKNARELDQWNEMVWHWCAAAEYRKGNISKARSYWKKCTELAPYFELARTNLDELKKPEHERISPQVFSLEHWISRKKIQAFASVITRASRKQDDEAFRQEAANYLDVQPEFIQFVPAALSCGDAASRDFALNLADMSAHPAILDQLKAFCLAQDGPDALRLKASQILSKHGIFKSGETIELWLAGEWKPIMMMGFQISYDPPEKPTLKPTGQKLMEQAIYALRDDKGAEAEIYLRKALEIQNNDPGLHNNLAVALSMQGKHTEAAKIADEIPLRFPDYFFGQVIAVRKAMQSGDMEKAREILAKMMQKQEMHVTEFGAMCACQIDFLLEDEKPEGAISWFGMWKEGYPDDPGLKKYEGQLVMLEALTKLKNGFPKRRKRKTESQERK